MRLTNLFRKKQPARSQSDPSGWSNDEWLTALTGQDPSAALESLRIHLVRGLHIVLDNRDSRVSHDDIDDFVQDALVRIMSNIGSFRGDSQFTTWSQKIAVRVAFSQMRRKQWQNVSLDAMAEQSGTQDPFAGGLADTSEPADVLAGRAMVADMLRQMMTEELTERQRLALRAVALDGMPMEEVARQMGTNRNALYKMMHDARKRLKAAIEARNLDLDDLMEGEE